MVTASIGFAALRLDSALGHGTLVDRRGDAMELWFAESESPGTRWCAKVVKPLFSAEGSSGRIEIFETEDFGKTLSIGGRIVHTEADGFARREMLVHAPLNVLPTVESVLVFGAEDGGIAAELLRYPEINRIVLVENDAVLLEACKRHFRESASLSDSRVRVIEEVAGAYARDSRERFDLVIASGAAGTADGSPGQSFYSDCFRLLSGDGAFIAPAGGAFFPTRKRELAAAAGRLKRLFPIYRPFRAEPPSGFGPTLLGFASKKYDPIRDLDAARWEARGLETRYYDSGVHRAAFVLPRYLRDAVDGA
jgi:spermidine synthase